MAGDAASRAAQLVHFALSDHQHRVCVVICRSVVMAYFLAAISPKEVQSAIKRFLRYLRDLGNIES